DQDNFKLVNDHFGHQVGDIVLTTVVRCAISRLRRTDIVARLGGDEFIFLLPETDQKMAQQALPKIRHDLLEIMHQNHWPVTFSIGVLTCENASLSTHEVIKKVDDLMYQVKNDGKNEIRYSVYTGH
ncbi:MAG: GGDEF domain-containing protein, partial [Anaerolineaceae bacterium]|nr:GGDEF domain-containing protein [Anaerolineaceae bacterium]